MKRTVELSQASEDLRRNEQRYRSLVKATTAVEWSTAASGLVESDQPDWADFAGQPLDQIKGQGWLDAVHPDDRAHTASAWSSAMATQTLYQVEHRVRRRDGEYRYMRANAVPIKDAEGAVLEWVGIHADITEQRWAEEALAESERFARSTLDALSAHIAILDERGLILATNKAWRQFAAANGAKVSVGVGANYLEVCDGATGPCGEEAATVAAGIRASFKEIERISPWSTPAIRLWKSAGFWLVPPYLTEKVPCASSCPTRTSPSASDRKRSCGGHTAN